MGRRNPSMLGGRSAAVWQYLVDHADRSGHVTAGMAAIAAGLGESTPPRKERIKEALATLQDAGLIQVTARPAGSGTTYRLHVPGGGHISGGPADKPADKPVDKPGESQTRGARPGPATGPAPDARTGSPADDAHARLVGEWLADDSADEDLAADIAAWVAGIWSVRHGGPTDHETALQVRPDLVDLPTGLQHRYAAALIRHLRDNGWLTTRGPDRELAPGPRHHTTRTTSTTSTTSRHAGGARPVVLDRPY